MSKEPNISLNAETSKQTGMTPPPKTPANGEYTQLKLRYETLKDHVRETERNKLLFCASFPIFVFLLVFYCWKCEWVSIEFMLSVAGVAIAVVSFTAGVAVTKFTKKGRYV